MGYNQDIWPPNMIEESRNWANWLNQLAQSYTFTK